MGITENKGILGVEKGWKNLDLILLRKPKQIADNYPKKPQRQSNIRDDREPTPDYDSTGDKPTDKSPLATSLIKKSPNQLEQSGGSSDNQTRATPAGQVKTT